MAEFTHTQGRYLAFIHAYTSLHGRPPAEAEIAAAMCVSAPSVNQMVKNLEKRGLILRRPGQARSLQILISEDLIPAWNQRTSAKNRTAGVAAPAQPAPRPAAPVASVSANLFVLYVQLASGPVGGKFAGKEISRTIEIPGDRTLADLHEAVFQAYDRHDPHEYEFQFGKGPHDPKGHNYGVPDQSSRKKKKDLDARTTKLDDLGLMPGRAFGYWFDFGDDWYHQIRVERIERPIPTVTYPRVIKRVGKSPPQYAED